MKKRTLVSIINWNNNVATNKCLATIANLQAEKQPDIWLIDNASGREELQINKTTVKRLKSLHVVKNKQNVGFAGGHNQSLKHALAENYDIVVLLNNDTEIIDPYVFDTLGEALAANQHAIAAAPTVLSQAEPPRIWFGGGKLSTPFASTHHLRLGQTPSGGPPEFVSFLNGTCLAIDMKKIRKWGELINEDYFLYWEDADWCARAVKAGYKLLYVPSTKILHSVSSSLGLRSPHYAYYNLRNNLLFLRRHTPPIYRPLAYTRSFYITLKYILHALAHPTNRHQNLSIIKLAWRDGLRNIGGPLRSSE